MNLFGPHQRVAAAICTPIPAKRLPNGQMILDTITVEWHRHRNALATPTNWNQVELFADGMEVGVARTGVAYRCLEMDPQPTYILFLDFDVLPDHDALTKLYYRACTHPEYDVYSGVYCCKRHNPPDPLIYAGFGMGPYWDWAIGDLLTTDGHGVNACHMGLTLIRVSLFQRMLDAGVVNAETPFFKTVSECSRVNGAIKTRRGTEDLWFFSLAHEVDCKLLVDTSVLAGHIDKYTGITWGLPDDSPPVKRARWLKGKDKECTNCNGTGKSDSGTCALCNGTGSYHRTQLALDIGAGDHRRQWPGHKTYTLDIRPEVKPDYCQDSRWLNIPDDHYDLVASSHHFEHIGRWDQGKVWSESFRVCKPGGKVEVIVPSIEWAAAKIADGQTDQHVLNVLYGAQEAHGYERNYNTHYFGYTKELGQALAEEAGFIDVSCRDWRDDNGLAYNLVITGRKPGEGEIIEEAAEPQSECHAEIHDECGNGLTTNERMLAPLPE